MPHRFEDAINEKTRPKKSAGSDFKVIKNFYERVT